MTKPLFAALLTLLLLPSAGVAADPVAACEASQMSAAGRYFECLAKAQKILIVEGDATAYDLSASRCQLKFQRSWTNAFAVAAKDGASCTNSDPAPLLDYLSACSQQTAGAVGGDALSDCSTCSSDLATCNGSLTSCSTNLSSTNADLGTCNTALATCQAGTSGTCGADLATCQGDLAACTSNCVAAVRPPLATGQTTSYGPQGSDGDLRPGAGRSFTDNGDGTITDNVTGLMWEKKSDNGDIHDWDNQYTWSTGDNMMNGTMVTTFLASLNSGAGFAGHTDWRVPSISELLTLVNYEGPAPFIRNRPTDHTYRSPVLICDHGDQWRSPCRNPSNAVVIATARRSRQSS